MVRIRKQRQPSEMIRQIARCFATIFVLTTQGGPAQAADPVDAPFNGTFEYYGQLSPAYLSFDDGGQKTNQLVDNTNSNSRLGMWYRHPMRWGRLNVNFETALGLSGSNTASQINLVDDWNWTTASIRKAEVIWETKRFGTFYVGQGSMASDGIANRDLSGTSIVSYVGIPDTAGAFFLRTRADVLSPVAIAQAFPNFDGGRRARVRYDSPSYRGIVVSASIGEQILATTLKSKDSDITVRYDWDGAKFRISGASGYTWIDRKTLVNNRTFVGSVSIEHKATGLSFTTSSGKRDTAGNYRYFKLGYKAELPRVGPFSISVDYYAANNMVSGGSRSESYGMGILQRFSNPRVEAYLGLRSYGFSDKSLVRYRDAHSVMFGARWKF